jgi:hypothetical protein
VISRPLRALNKRKISVEEKEGTNFFSGVFLAKGILF